MRIISIILSIVFFLLGLLLPVSIEIKNIFLMISYGIVGWKVILESIQSIMKKEFLDEKFLMTIATLGAFFISKYSEAVAVMLLYQIGELFQDYAVQKSKKSIVGLMDLRPDYANVKLENKVVKKSPEEVSVGDLLVVYPGEKVPLDGIIIEGKSFLNTANLTGESVPRKVGVGDTILSGTVNEESVLTVKVTSEYAESTVQKILDLVEHATDKKTKSEKFITKFSRIYTPIVVVLALLLVLVPTLLFQQNFSIWLYRALSFLVVSCPCALVLSIPLSFFSGIGSASKMGALIKGSTHLENLEKVKTIVCDKTGTLTEGVFQVQKIYAKNMKEEELLWNTVYAECFSHHPIAKSLKDYYGKEIDEKLVGDVYEFTGRGLKATVDGKEVLVGNDKLMKEKGISYEKNNDLGTILYVAINHVYQGSIVISDTIKKGAKKTIHTLQKKGMKVVMLTGDKTEISESLSAQLGIQECYSLLLPQDKVEKVEDLKKQNTGFLMFIGDGMNDAPVLALADIGVAMGGIGSDAAIESADIVIMNDDICTLDKLISLSRKVMKIVKENIAFAITVKVLILGLSAFGITTMWCAVFGDVGVTILAVLNSFRALR